MDNKVIESVKNLAKPLVTNLGYELVDVTYECVEGERYITVIIYNENGITFDDCKKVSKALDEPLDELNPTNDLSYSLNVSSLGLDRPIKTVRDFERYLNKDIEIYQNSKKIVGTLLEVNNETIKLKVKVANVTFKLAEIDKAMPYIKF